MYIKVAIACMASLFTIPAAAAELLINGGLNSTATHPIFGVPSLLPGSTAIEGWTIIGSGDLAMIPVAAFNTSPFEGNYYAELMGYTDRSGFFTGVSQNITTVSGKSYVMSFYMGRIPGDSATMGVQAAAGAISQNFAVSGNQPWTKFTLNFVAAGAVTPISILGIQGRYHIGLDAISVTSAGVPEPASWALLLSGFGVTGAAVRRRRSALAKT